MYIYTYIYSLINEQSFNHKRSQLCFEVHSLVESFWKLWVLIWGAVPSIGPPDASAPSRQKGYEPYPLAGVRDGGWASRRDP